MSFASGTTVSPEKTQGDTATVVRRFGASGFVSGWVSTFETELLAYVLLPNGNTVGDWIGPQLEAASYGAMPKLLPRST